MAVAAGRSAALAFAIAAFGFLWFGNSPDRGFAVLAGMLLGAALVLPVVARTGPRRGPAQRARADRGLVLGRQPPATFRLVAGADGAAARAVGQCRRRHHGRKLQPDLCELARRPARRRRLPQRRRTMRRPRRSRPGCASGATSTPSCPAAAPKRSSRMRRWKFSAFPITRPIAITGRCCASAENAWDAPAARQCGFRQRTTGAAHEACHRRSPSTCRRRAETGRCEVVGIYADYGNPKGQIAVNFDALTRHFPEHPADADRLARRACRCAGADVGACARNSDSTTVTSIDQATLKAELNRIFNRTFAVTAALNAFTLGVAGVALLTSLLTLGNSRLPQLAPLWAIGITRRQAGRDRASQDDVGCADHGAARAAARPAGRLVPDRGRECEGVRLAPAVSCLPAATGRASRCRHGGLAGWRPPFPFSSWCGCSRQR